MPNRPVVIDALRTMSPSELRSKVNGFATGYVEDWKTWLAAGHDRRPELFGRILRRWQATRPQAMRRLRRETNHEAPYLEDLLEAAAEPLRTLESITLLKIAQRKPAQNEALNVLWNIFSRLPTSGVSSCVGITKAVLLLTDGRIGPAFDSQVRKKLGVGRPETCREWLQRLEDIGEDIAAFEAMHDQLADAVSSHFAQLGYGRLYDMALGPR